MIAPSSSLPSATVGSVVFDDGSAAEVPVTPEGSATEIGDRTVSSARLTIRSAAIVSAVDWSVDRVSAEVPASGGFVARPTASSNGGGIGALALIDGNPATGATGNEWAPNPTDANPTVTLSWETARSVSSVQVLGPSAVAFDPASSASASLWGDLVFDDGSRVRITGIEGGDSQPTTIGFPAETTRSVTLELHRTIPQANPGLREFAVFPSGTTPPRWAVSGPAYTSRAADVSCSDTSPAIGASSRGALALVCPATGAAVSGTFPVTAVGIAGAVVDAYGFLPRSRTVGVVATGTVSSSGRVTLSVDGTQLGRGPAAVQLRYRQTPASTTATPLTVQIFNRSGQTVEQSRVSPAGKTLVYEDEFRDGISVTRLGENSRYAATKPAYWGPSEFGEAIFADPQLGAGTISSLEADYLRIRAQPRGSLVDPYPWGRNTASGIISSMKVGGTGFAAQYGYYEARILAPAAPGTWPAFWMLNSESTANRDMTSSGEVDAVELYGHDTQGACNAVHSWRAGNDADTVRCQRLATGDDWSVAWHTYGVQIQPDGATYYIDGKQVNKLTGLSHSEEPFFFMLNLSMGGGWPIDLSQYGGVRDMYVDWVRVYA